jgi:homogentisate phytyltransferase/homogentisate geranylgeranyltransferase
MRFLLTFWQFSRPHTIIGSTLSIIALYALAAYDVSWNTWAVLLLPSLLSALACNVYITGLNQWSDVEVDRINKPWLPIPAGQLTRTQALTIVLIAGSVALLLAAWFGIGFFALILLIMGIGTAYSLPPLKFKRHHLLAAAAIAVVRGLLVNIGFYLHFRYELTGAWLLSSDVIPLTVFVVAFSLGIAWFKDIPDTEGDAAYRFGTLAVRIGRQRAFILGVLAVSVAYVWIVVAAALGYFPNPVFYMATHTFILNLFWWQSRRLQVGDTTQVKRFYYFFWGLFFLEYLLYPIGFYL